MIVNELVATARSRAPQEILGLSSTAPYLNASKPLAATDTTFVRRASNLSSNGQKPSAIDFERIIGTNDLLDLNWLERGLVAAHSICRIILRDAAGRVLGYATGFLVSPGLLLTNNHVFGSPGDAEHSIAEFAYELDIDGRPKRTSRFAFSPGKYFFTSAQDKLDYTLVAVGPPDGQGASLESFGWLRLNPDQDKVLEREWMTIIQHPSGEPKQVAARENQLLKIAENTLWYATDTAPGSSGAPVFNDSWQVVALHHSGIPATDANGHWLGPDGQPAPSNPGENQVKWIANEGIRISRIVASIEKDAPPGRLKDDFLAVAHGTLISKESAPVVVAPNSMAVPGTSTDGRSPATVRPQDDWDLVLTQNNGSLSILMPQSALRSLRVGLAAPAVVTLPEHPAELEKFVLDPDYESRTGYDQKFLGVPVPLPTLTAKARNDAAKVKDGSGTELKYHHFSLVMSAERRMLFFSAENSDRELLGKKGRKQLAEGASDKWIYDERIDRELQIDDKFYRGSGFDHGHVVRREDNYWGETDEEATYSNFDTFHFTNCTPQHPAYNRSSEHGLWGELENYLAEESGAKKPKLTLFAGPVFSDSDIKVRGELVPKQFWKIVLADRDEGGIAAFAFVLSQEQLVRDMEEDIAAGPFKTYQIPIGKLEKLLDVRFDEVIHKADAYDPQHAGSDEKMEVSYLEEVKFPRK